MAPTSRVKLPSSREGGNGTKNRAPSVGEMGGPVSLVVQEKTEGKDLQRQADASAARTAAEPAA